METTSGPVAGVADDDAVAFRGIRYGVAERFRLPTRPEPGREVFDAASFGPACPPTLTEADRAFFPTSSLWREYAGYDVVDETSEDCLRLNIWTSSLEPEARRPVLVWLHGGGFSWGSSASRWTEGDRLASRCGLVVVSLTHRLGVLGYLNLEGRDGNWEGSGVAGLVDIRLALEWIHDNIARFGGDPDRVTVAGHSGGGAKVAALMALPSARGLFHRVVIQSGVVSLRSVDRDEADEAAERLIELAGGISALEAMPAERLTRLAAPYRFRPAARTALLPQHPFDPAAASSASGLPLLIGTTTDDTATFKFDSDPRFGSIGADELTGWVADHRATAFGDHAEDAVALYRRQRPGGSPTDVLVAAATGRLRERTLALIERKQALDAAPVFVYHFSYAAPLDNDVFGGRSLSWHGLELPFVFDVADRIRIAGSRGRDSRLAETMSTSWASFAADGNPGWPRWEPKSRLTMVFDTESRVEPDQFTEEQRLFELLKETTWTT